MKKKFTYKGYRDTVKNNKHTDVYVLTYTRTYVRMYV